MRVVFVIACALAFSACAGREVKPDLPPVETAVIPQVHTVQRIVYVPVPPNLTRQEDVPEGPITQCFDVAAQRRAVIQRQNARLKAIGEIQGTGVKP